MQTSNHTNTPIIPPHGLWAAGLLLVSGCRADAVLPHLQMARQPAGNRPAREGKVPDAWGASGTDSLLALAAGVASLWEGRAGAYAKTAQWCRRSAVLGAREFLLCGVEPVSACWQGSARAASVAGDIADTVRVLPGATFTANRPGAENERDAPCGRRVVFIPKPDPWHCGGGVGTKTLKGSAPGSFCRKIVTFTPTPDSPR